MKYIANKDNKIISVGYDLISVSAGYELECGGTYCVNVENGVSVPFKVIERSKDWDKQEIERITLSEDKGIIEEKPKKWRLEIPFESTTDKAIEFKEAATKLIGALMKQIGIKLEEQAYE